MRPLSILPALACALALAAWPGAAPAQDRDPSAPSDLSALPIVLSVDLPSVLLVAGATFTVASVESSADVVTWVLENAADGARLSVRVAGHLVAGASIVAGTAVVVTVMATGTLISAAGQVIAFVPNELGRALLEHRQVTR